MAEWEDQVLAKKVLTKLGELPPLVQPKECDRLKQLLAECGRGERFIVQGGDCAERFMDCQAARLEQQLKLILQMGMVIEHISGKKTLKVCRIAGQYGKPRSKPTEMGEDGKEIMSFKASINRGCPKLQSLKERSGDNINGFDPKDRKWDPERLLLGYWHSAATLNYLRSYVSNGDHAPLKAIEISDLKASEHYGSHSEDAQAISSKALTSESLEAWHMAIQGKQINWGVQTRGQQESKTHRLQAISARRPSMLKLKDLVKILNPNKEEGRLMLITRYGAGKAEAMLPGHIQAVKESGVPVTWQCDAVHGNGIVAKSNKLKTRLMNDILAEACEVMAIHKKCGSVLGGIHMEVSGQPVTEVVGGSMGLTEQMLTKNYETYCDPRMNYSQAIEAAFRVANEMPSQERAAKRSKVA
eukprot:Skav225554  [mRNA]  locus=scaffold81:297130:302013:+ [translate_table: standard]